MNIIGIDLGTTFCAISKINAAGQPEIIPFSNGDRLLASCILYMKDGKKYFGQTAINQMNLNPSGYVELIKRFMGEDYYPFLVNGEKKTPVDLTADLLSYIKKDFEDRYGKIDKVVITAPAYFDDKRVNATLKAAKKAGLNSEVLLQEPTSAGLYYANQFPSIEGKVLIFDLGGGTFDVSLLNIKRAYESINIEVITIGGDHALGGKDFDRAIFNYVNEKYKEEWGHPIVDQSNEIGLNGERRLTVDEYELMRYIDTRIKQSLSDLEEIDGKFDGKDGRIRLKLTRKDFETMIFSYIQKIKLCVEGLLDNKNISPSDVDHIILVGGSSRIKYFEDYLTSVFNKIPKRLGNLDEAVALGAALQCAILGTDGGRIKTIGGEPIPQDILKTAASNVLQDVCSHSFGTIANDNNGISTNYIVIPKDTKIPCSKTSKFSLTRDGQDSVNEIITQGESSNPDEVRVVHSLNWEIGKRGKKGDEVITTYSYDRNKKMHCTFSFPLTGKTVEIDLDTGKEI
jgi:molecular chaperone DnaK